MDTWDKSTRFRRCLFWRNRLKKSEFGELCLSRRADDVSFPVKSDSVCASCPYIIQLSHSPDHLMRPSYVPAVKNVLLTTVQPSPLPTGDSDRARDRPSIKTHQTWPEVQNRRLPRPPHCQSEADLPDRLWQSGKEMDGIRININPVNCLLRSPNLSCTLRVFYLPHLNILPKVSLTLPWYKSKKKNSAFLS